jgi:hypothetical protein
MPSKETLLKDLDWVTEKISTQIWVLNLGTLGTTWSLLITATIPDRFKLTFVQARWVFLFCFLALLCELGQYLSSYMMYRRILSQMEQSRVNEFQFDRNSFLWTCRICYCYLKITLTIVAAIVLLAMIFLKLR